MGMDAPSVEERAARAERALDARLAELGESACIASLPLLADEIASEVAGDDPALAETIARRLRARAGLRPDY